MIFFWFHLVSCSSQTFVWNKKLVGGFVLAHYKAGPRQMKANCYKPQVWELKKRQKQRWYSVRCKPQAYKWRRKKCFWSFFWKSGKTNCYKHQVCDCRMLKEGQASFVGICFAPKMPLFKAQSGKSATPFKIAFYNDWEKRQRQSRMIALPLMSTTPEWRSNSYFQMPVKLDRGERLQRQSWYHILYVEKNTEFFSSGITCSRSVDQSIC